jgi:hypothetical protein
MSMRRLEAGSLERKLEQLVGQISEAYPFVHREGGGLPSG